MRFKIYLSCLLSTLLCTLSSNIINAQVVITTQNDTTVCDGGTLTLRAHNHGRHKTVLSLPIDDQYSGTIPIGFTFNFYGNNYSRCIVSSNGYISFDSSGANSSSAWELEINPGLIPGNIACRNSICGVYSDIYPVLGGSIDYATVGTAPNRQFVVTFCSVPLFSCNSQLISFQMILYETSNLIEVHIKHKDVCPGWNGGFAIEGVQNADGTAATVVPGRNDSTQWWADNDAYRFTPDTPGYASYTVASIPFNPIPDSLATLNWYEGSTYLGTGTSIDVTPTGPTTYTVYAIDCGDTSQASVNVLIGGGPHIDSAVAQQPSSCGACDGKITLYGLAPNELDTIYYSKNGIPQPPLGLLTSPTGTVTLVNLCVGVYSNIRAKSSVCTSPATNPVTLSNPAVVAGFTYDVHYGCSGDTVIFNDTSYAVGSTLNYKWIFGDGAIDTAFNPVHVFTAQGNYNVQLQVSTVACGDSTAQMISLVHPIAASFTASSDTICQHQTITFTNTSVGTNPTYYWDFGDGGNSTDVSPSYTFDHSGQYNVKLVERDFVPCYDSVSLLVNIDSISFINYAISDSTVCQGQAITFTGDYLTQNSLGNYWNFGDNTIIKDQNPIVHAFENPGTYYVSFTANFRVCPDTTYGRTISVHAFPDINIGQDTAMCPGSAPITILDSVNNGNPNAQWLWNTGDSTSSITVSSPGTYSATVTINGCSNADTIFVRNDCYISIPNVFTPNGDGINDYFLPRQFLSSGLTDFKMDIYDRWGELIFETNSLNGRGWDGTFNDKPQPAGVYIYVLDAKFKNGYEEHHQGNVTLLR